MGSCLRLTQLLFSAPACGRQRFPPYARVCNPGALTCSPTPTCEPAAQLSESHHLLTPKVLWLFRIKLQPVRGCTQADWRITRLSSSVSRRNDLFGEMANR